jgi:pimeloyl-ACP methyl ester carboxylesterase
VEVDGPAAPPVSTTRVSTLRGVRVIRWILLVLLGLVLTLTLASVAYNASTSEPNLPVSKLWQGRTLDGTAYRQWGTSGPAIVLLGGFLEPSFVWQQVGPLLAAQGYRVYALDLDGFGYTERRGPWTLQHWGDQVQAFDRARGLKRPIVVGHSLGAAVAVEMARRGLASRIVLLDGDALSSGAGPPRFVLKALTKSPYFTTIYRFLLRSPWAVKRILAGAYGPNHPTFTDADVRRWTDQFRAKDARRALEGLAQRGIAGFRPDDLRRLEVPALVVWGANDTVDPVEAGRRSARDLGARFILVPGAGHLSMLAAPDAVARAIASPRSAARP